MFAVATNCLPRHGKVEEENNALGKVIAKFLDEKSCHWYATIVQE